jgi:hypothetical protein
MLTDTVADAALETQTNSFSRWWLTELNLAFCTDPYPFRVGGTAACASPTSTGNPPPRAPDVAHDLRLQSR